MLKNYLKIAVRKMKNCLGYSLINIIGLAMGIACCILISLWVVDEMSFDSFHENGERIYNIVNLQKNDFHAIEGPLKLAEGLKEDFPEVELSTHYLWGGKRSFKVGENTYYETPVFFTDSSFLNIFSFPLVRGDKNSALSNPNSIVIDEQIAKKYFGNENPLGKTIIFDNNCSLSVTGVLKKLPANTSIEFCALIPMEIFLQQEGREMAKTPWLGNALYTYVQLRDERCFSDFAAKIKDYGKKKTHNRTLQEYYALPLNQIYFSAWYEGSNRMMAISIFSAIAFFVLIIACINFVNLSIAGSAKRALEIGLRKVVGASRRDAVIQFMGEFFLFILIAFLLSILLVVLFLPVFGGIFGKELVLSNLFKDSIVFILLGILLFVGLIGGGYPALVISSFKPSVILKEKSGARFRKSVLRRALVVFQFLLSITLIIMMNTIYSQYNFMRNRESGFNKDQVLYMELVTGLKNNYEAMKEKFAALPGVLSVTGADQLTTNIANNFYNGVSWNGGKQDEGTFVYFGNIDYDYCKTLDIQIVEGHDFTNQIKSETVDGLIVNEEMARLMGRKNVVGQTISVHTENYKVVGVMKNFHNLDMRRKVPPLILGYGSDSNKYLMIKLASGTMPGVIAQLKAKWEEINPDVPFECHFMDEEFDQIYKKEERLGKTVGFFSMMAIVISILGLFGLASYTAEQRKKEIAIRKVLGSTVNNVIKILFKEYLYLVLAANLIAWPLGYYIAEKWIENFAYKISIRIEIFVLAGLAALALMAIAVGYQSIKAATANPIENLRSE